MLSLVPFSKDQFAALARWFPDERSLVQWGGPGLQWPLDQQQMASMLAEEVEVQPPLRLCRSAIDDCSGIVGHVQIVLNWDKGLGRICRVAIDPEKRGRGFAALMLSLALSLLFGVQGMRHAELHVYTWNSVALRTYEKLGFELEAVRKSSVRVGGEQWDHATMRLSIEDWKSRAPGV